MSKKITMSARAKPNSELDKWVETREPVATKENDGKPKRLTIDIAPELHMNLKISCAKRGIQIADLVRTLIEHDLRGNEEATSDC